MARATAITNSKVLGPNVAGSVTANAITQSSAFYVDSTELDERTVFVFTPSASSTELVVTAGTGYAGTTDLTLTAAAASTGYAFTLDSARYAIASGENAGLIKMEANKAGTLAIIQAKV